MSKLREFVHSPGHRYVTKWDHYLDVYERYLPPFVGKSPVLVELGVYRGGSLEMWNHYFNGKCTIVGVDIRDYSDNCFEGSHFYKGSADSVDLWNRVFKKHPWVDIFIDDAFHFCNQQKATFKHVFPRLQPGSLYFIEDIHTSYRAKWGGGLKALGSFVEYMKDLVDGLTDAFYNESRDFGTCDIGPTNWVEFVHFYDSLIVVGRGDRPKPLFLEGGE